MILSIVIPMYNVEKYIDKCLSSCYCQNIPQSEYEVVCVNDGSPDKSSEIAKEFSKTHPNLKVIDRVNGGLSAARNTGIDNSKGEYIFFLDSDDWIAENCLEKIIQQLRDESPDILAICAANVIGNSFVRRVSHDGKYPMTGIEVMKRGISPCAPFSITRRGLLNENKLRFFEGIYHEDSEFTPRLYYYAKKVSFTNDIIYYVYQNPESITRKPNPKKVFDVIGVVCPRLHEFSKNLTEEEKNIFSNRISSDINTALSHSGECSNEQIEKINSLLYQNRFLFRHLKRSSLLKYKIEGYLFSLFPHKSVEIYYFLQNLNFRRKA